MRVIILHTLTLLCHCHRHNFILFFNFPGTMISQGLSKLVCQFGRALNTWQFWLCNEDKFNPQLRQITQRTLRRRPGFLPTGAPNAAETPAAAPAETKSRFSVSLLKYSKIYTEHKRQIRWRK